MRWASCLAIIVLPVNALLLVGLEGLRSRHHRFGYPARTSPWLRHHYEANARASATHPHISAFLALNSMSDFNGILAPTKSRVNGHDQKLVMWGSLKLQNLHHP